MGIHGLSPLQAWLERIDSYLTKEEIMKARMASLVLPIFEAMELLTVVRRVCFHPSSVLEEPRSHLIVKASFLAFNVLFSWYMGFKDPRNCYRFHKDCDLIVKEKPILDEIKEEIQDNDDDFDLPPQTKREAEIIKEELRPFKGNVESKPPLPNQDESPTPFHSPDAIQNNSSPNKNLDNNVRNFITKLKRAPQTLERKNSFRKATQELADRVNIATKKFKSVPLRRKSFLHLPHGVNEKNVKQPKLRRLSSAPSIMEVFEFPQMINQKEDLKIKSTPNLFVHNQKLNIEEIAKVTPHKKQRVPHNHLHVILDELKPILAFIEEARIKDGSWTVKKGKIHFVPGRESDFPSKDVFNILAEVHRKGLFSFLTLDQAYNLNANLKIFDLPVSTMKTDQMRLFSDMSKTIQNHTAKLEVEEDYQAGLFYNSCYKLIAHIIHLVNNKQNFDVEGRLFEQVNFDDLSELIQKWKYSFIDKKDKTSMHESYFVLQGYLENYLTNLPDVIQQKWGLLNQAQTPDEWHQAVDSLPPEDKKLIVALLNMLSIVHHKMWENELENMLKAAYSITSLLCPLQPVDDQNIEENTINTDLLSQILTNQT